MENKMNKEEKKEVNKEVEGFTTEDYSNLFTAVGLIKVPVGSKENQDLQALLLKIQKLAQNIK